MIPENFFFKNLKRFFRAGIHARAAGFAPIFPIGHLRVQFLGLRIMAPIAAQRAAFEVYACSNTRPIIDSVSLYVKNDPQLTSKTETRGLSPLSTISDVPFGLSLLPVSLAPDQQNMCCIPQLLQSNPDAHAGRVALREASPHLPLWAEFARRRVENKSG